MKKMGELMQELGFKPGANEEVTKAFIKNLIREAQVQGLSRKRSFEQNSRDDEQKNIEEKPQIPEQLSLFNKMSS